MVSFLSSPEGYYLIVFYLIGLYSFRILLPVLINSLESYSLTYKQFLFGGLLLNLPRNLTVWIIKDKFFGAVIDFFYRIMILSSLTCESTNYILSLYQFLHLQSLTVQSSLSCCCCVSRAAEKRLEG